MGLNNIATSIGGFLMRPIETRTEETIDVKGDYYQETENRIKEQVIALLNREGTEVNWHSNGDNVIIRNKVIKTRFLITKTKQRVMWQTESSMDTLPTTITFIDKLLKVIRDREDKLFELLTKDILEERTSRMVKINSTIESVKEIDLSDMV